MSRKTAVHRTVNAGGNQLQPRAATERTITSRITMLSQLSTRITALEQQYGLNNQICIDISRSRILGAVTNGNALQWTARMWLADGHQEIAQSTGPQFDTVIHHVLENANAMLPQYTKGRGASVQRVAV
jgi:hypothetical protein